LAAPHTGLCLPATHLVPTLLPYTTLFRSLRRDVLHQELGQPLWRDPVDGSDDDAVAMGEGQVLVDPDPRLEVRVGELAGREHELDRKSTRLNSSHQIISYAFFCSKENNDK